MTIPRITIRHNTWLLAKVKRLFDEGWTREEVLAWLADYRQIPGASTNAKFNAACDAAVALAQAGGVSS